MLCLARARMPKSKKLRRFAPQFRNFFSLGRHVPRDWELAGCPRSLVLDKEDTASAVDLVRIAIEREGGGASSLAPAFMERSVLKGALGHDGTKPLDPKEQEDVQDHLTGRPV